MEANVKKEEFYVTFNTKAESLKFRIYEKESDKSQWKPIFFVVCDNLNIKILERQGNGQQIIGNHKIDYLVL